MKRLLLSMIVSAAVISSMPTRARAMSDLESSALLAVIAIPGTLDAVLIWSDVYMAATKDPPSRGYYKFEAIVAGAQLPIFMTIAIVASAKGSKAASLAWGLVALPAIPLVHGIYGLATTSPEKGEPAPPSPGFLDSRSHPDTRRFSLTPTLLMTDRQTTPGLALFGRF